MSNETDTEPRIAFPNPELPTQDMQMALCIHCNKPIMALPGIPGWNHGHNGNPSCDAPRVGDEAIEAAERVIRGEGLPEDLRPSEGHTVGLDDEG